MSADRERRHRINAGRVALKNQIPLFRRYFGQVVSEWKADATRVTFADFAIAEGLLGELRRHFPRDHLCSEDGLPGDETVELTDPYAWVLDPVDGTNNYALGLPACAISLALLHHGVPVYGWIYDHARDTLVQGGPGEGLYDGCNRAALKTEPFGRDSFVALHFPLAPAEAARLAPLLGGVRVRALGSAALAGAYVATGRLDGLVDSHVKVWDVAAAHALLHAVGATVRFHGESPFPLRTFSPAAPDCPWTAGTASFVAAAAPG